MNVLKRYNITWINDFKGDLNDDTLKDIAQSGCNIVIMHSLSIPPRKHNIISDSINSIDTVNCWAEKNMNRLLALGFDRSAIIIDSGIGFGKSPYQNIWLLLNIEALKRLG